MFLFLSAVCSAGIRGLVECVVTDTSCPLFQVEKVLALHELSSSTLLHTQGCSALDGQGLQPGLEKLYEMILKRKKMLRNSKKKR